MRKSKIHISKSLQEIRDIRNKIWEDIKDMSPDEKGEYYKKLSDKFEQESGIKLKKLQKV